MRKNSERNAVNRIIDANINRLKEGLRVCEEVARFTLEDRKLTHSLKQIRHNVLIQTKNFPDSIRLSQDRNSLKDVGKNIYINELKRKNTRDILLANIQRVKESIRVLEEFSKIINLKSAILFKRMRYQVYGIEKEIIKKLLTP